MSTREVTAKEFNSFWALFNEKHPDIDMQLPPVRTLVNGSIYCNQPAKMPNEVYDIYFRFLRRWYMENGFIPFDKDLVYVATNDEKAMAIDTASITSIDRIDMELTKVGIKENDIVNSVVIKEDADYFKKRVYIF